MRFNLIDEKWIPVLYADGRWDRVGIREAFTEAGRIRQIAATNPMDRVAILRFLLALLYWCKGSPPHKGSAISGDSFPADWFCRLDESNDCFNLFGDGKRLYQDRAARRSRTATDLIQEIPTGNNFWHFRHSTDRKDGLCPACCAMGLLRLPLFSVSGLPDLKAGINGTPPIYVVPWGTSLLKTLLANWAQCSLLGTPAWVQPTIRPAPDEVVPLLTGLTLLSRRVWLHDPSAPPGMCVGCGARERALIRTCEFQTAGKQQNDLWDDPHVVYLDKTPRKAAKAPDPTAAGKFRMDRPWAELLARISETYRFEPGHRSTALLIVGFATDQAKNIDAWERTIAVPTGTPIKGMSAFLLQQWRKEGGRLEKWIERIVRSKAEGAAAIAAIRPQVEDSVSAKAGELIASDAGAWEQAAREYRPMMEMVAQSLSPGFTTAAAQRRRQIARVTPDMQPKAQSEKKPGRKKGGTK
jgi:hypothetical protein